VPRTGEAIRVNGYELFVEQVFRRRVKRVSVRRVQGEPPAEPVA
jgi:CBS domain containing-hemolysin-like protein